jgi:hypothetical protein
MTDPYQCEGTWCSIPRMIETETPELIYLSSCSGCDCILVTFRGRQIPEDWYDAETDYPSSIGRFSTDLHILEHVTGYLHYQHRRKENY